MFCVCLLFVVCVCVTVCASENIVVNTNTMNIVVDGDRVSGDNFVYENTTYVPLRKIAEMLGKKVDWDPSINGAVISDTTETVTLSENTDEGLFFENNKTIAVDRNTMNIYVNGTLVDADNFVYSNTTYVPLRKVAEMLSKEVNWEKISNTASIGKKGIGFFDGTVLGTINGYEFTDYMYDYYAAAYADEVEYYEMIGEDPSAIIGSGEKEYVYDKLKFDFALIDHSLALGRCMTPYYHWSYYESVKSTLKGIKGDPERFDAMLKMQGFTSLNSYYYAMVVSDLYVQFAREYVDDVTSEEVEKYYNDNQELRMEFSLSEAYDDITMFIARDKASAEIEKMAENVVLTVK